MVLHCGARGVWHLARTTLTLGGAGPDPFSFTEVTSAALSTTYESNVVTVSGLAAPASLTVSGGVYSINGGAYAATATTVSNGDTVKVSGAASGAVSTAVDVVLTIGAVPGTFRMTTVANSEASALIGRFTADPGAARRGVIDTLVGALKAASLWSKIDVLQVYAAHDGQAALLNWITNTYNGGGASLPTFAANQGYTGDAATTFIDSGFSETTAGANFQAASGVATVAFGVSGATPGGDVATDYVVGIGGSASLRFNPRNGASFSCRFLGTSDMTIANAARAGRYLVTRDASPTANVYKNGALLGSGTPNAVTTSATNILALKSSTNLSDSRIQYLMIGGTNLWSATDAANFDAAIAAYLSAVGAT